MSMERVPKKQNSSRKHIRTTSIEATRKAIEEDFLSNIHTAQYMNKRKVLKKAVSPGMRARTPPF